MLPARRSRDDFLAGLDAVDEEISDEQRPEDSYSPDRRATSRPGGRIEARAVFGEHRILVGQSPEERS